MNIDIFRLFRNRQLLPQNQSSKAAERQAAEHLRRLALRRLFHRQEFSGQDGLNEYDHDYTRFTVMKDLVTREMQRAMARLKNVETAANGDAVQAADDLETASGKHDRSSASRT